MPNHITNILDVTGPEKEVAAFKKRVWRMVKEDKEFCVDFNSTVPMPEELKGTNSPAKTDEEKERAKELIKKYGYADWYQYHCAMWFLRHDEAYKKEYEFINDGYYDKVIDHYSKAGDVESPYSLKPDLLNRIKDIDLPRFLNFEWGECEDEYEKRMKGIKCTETSKSRH